MRNGSKEMCHVQTEIMRGEWGDQPDKRRESPEEQPENNVHEERAARWKRHPDGEEAGSPPRGLCACPALAFLHLFEHSPGFPPDSWALPTAGPGQQLLPLASSFWLRKQLEGKDKRGCKEKSSQQKPGHGKWGCSGQMPVSF